MHCILNPHEYRANVIDEWSASIIDLFLCRVNFVLRFVLMRDQWPMSKYHTFFYPEIPSEKGTWIFFSYRIDLFILQPIKFEDPPSFISLSFLYVRECVCVFVCLSRIFGVHHGTCKNYNYLWWLYKRYYMSGVVAKV